MNRNAAEGSAPRGAPGHKPRASRVPALNRTSASRLVRSWLSMRIVQSIPEFSVEIQCLLSETEKGGRGNPKAHLFALDAAWDVRTALPSKLHTRIREAIVQRVCLSTGSAVSWPSPLPPAAARMFPLHDKSAGP